MSLLKKKIGDGRMVLENLPDLNQEDQLVPTPQAILDQRVRQGKREILIHWKGLSPTEATWELRDVAQERPRHQVTSLQRADEEGVDGTS